MDHLPVKAGAVGYVVIHGHFYQPPRENPWIEQIEVESGAQPYHDWNARINAECYTPNAAAPALTTAKAGLWILSTTTNTSVSISVRP